MISTVERPRRELKLQRNAQFLKLVPDIKRQANMTLRDLRPQDREEAICEVVAYAYCAFRRLVELGRQDVAYASPLARFGVARFRSGRRVGNKPNSHDVYVVAARRQRGISLVTLRPAGTSSDDWAEALADDSLTPILDQVAFRLDFPAWLRGLKRRDRKLAQFLALGNTPNEAARQFKVSEARVSQLRRELHASWQAFQDESPQAIRPCADVERAGGVLVDS